MIKIKGVQFVTIGGILTSIAVILQAAPIFLPAIGMVLSPFSTLPIAVAAVCNGVLGIAVLLSSTLILLVISFQEALILLFTTGLLGVVLGVLLYKKGILVTLMATTISLTIGILILTYIMAVPGFVEFTSSIAFPLVVIIYSLFSLFYSGIWFVGFRRFANHLLKINVI